MVYWINLSDEGCDAYFQDIWGDVGVVSYTVNDQKGPSQSYMMVL
jgi:hypothetical protein